MLYQRSMRHSEQRHGFQSRTHDSSNVDGLGGRDGTDARILSLIEHVYEAVLSPDGWGDVVDGVCSVVGGSAATLAVCSRHANGVATELVIGSGDHDVDLRWWVDGLRARPVGVAPTTALFDSASRAHDSVHGRELASVLFKEHDRLGFIIITLAPPFDRDDSSPREILAQLTPHLGRALELQCRLKATTEARHGLSSLLNRLPFGVIVLDGSRRVELMNASAREIVEAHDGLSLDNGELRAATRGINGSLRSLITNALVSADRGIPFRGSIALQRPSMRRPLALSVQPLVAGIDGGRARPLVLVLVSDLDHRFDVDEELVREVFDLTPTETTVLKIMAEGKGLRRVAELLGVSINTVRTHAKRIFGKTGTQRQAELIRLLAVGLPTVRLTESAAHTIG